MKIKDILKNLVELLSPKENSLEYNYNTMAGIVPGGTYAGITFIPGNPNQKWDAGKEYGICPACKEGKLIFYWQDEYYKLQCNLCKYLHDTGVKLSKCQD